MKKVLVLCTGNSCRSQMAEALINDKLAGVWQAFSAGTDPAGYVHPKAKLVLEEINIHFEGESKHINNVTAKEFDSVITVCDDAAEKCPVWLGKEIRAHISFPDPAKAEGNEDDIMNLFRQVRDDIGVRVIAYLETL